MTRDSLRTSIVHINSYVLAGLIILSSFLLYVFTFEKRAVSEVTGVSFQLLSSGAFQQLKECVDVSEGHSCFDMFKDKLESEHKIGASTFSHSQLKRCLDTTSNNVGDMDLLLNIQGCFHQADIFEAAVSLTGLRGTNWAVKVAMAVSVIIQLLVSGHYFVSILFRAGDIEELGKQLQKLTSKTEFQDEKQEEIRDTASRLSDTIRLETKNIQDRLNKGGDVRRDLERLYRSLEMTNDECKRLSTYVFTIYNTSTAAILPPKSYVPDPLEQKENDESEAIDRIQVSSIPQQISVVHDNIPSTLHYSADSSKTTGDKHQITDGDSKKLSFDISTPEGRSQLKSYIKTNLGAKPSAELIETKVSTSPNNSSSVLNSINPNNSSANDDSKHMNRIRYQDVNKCDPNNKRFKRIFISGRGWVSLKKLEEEESLFGSSSFVRLDND